MNKKLETYVGVCDFLTKEQVEDMSQFFKQHVRSSQLQLMVGTMTSYKVLNGIETKWTKVFPKPEQLKDIFSVQEEHLANTIHYADYDNNSGLSNTLCEVIELCGEGLNAIQLDMVWPDPKELEYFKKQYNLPIVLQVSSKAMSACADNPIDVAEIIRTQYDDLVSHVLLDCSMGKGILINIPIIEGYIEAIKIKTSVEVAIAGGLGPETINQVQRLIEEYRVSIDAQGRLRASGNSEHPIDWSRAKEYVQKALSYYF